MSQVLTHRFDKLIQISVMISDDCEIDAYTLDGLPFDAKTVAGRLGEIYAMIKGIAQIQHKLLEAIRDDELKKQLEEQK